MSRPHARHAIGFAPLAALAALACAGARPPAPAAAPPGFALHVIAVPGHGALEIAAPAAWRTRHGEEQGGATTLELAPGDRAFLLLVTPFTYDGADGDPPQQRADAARLLVDLARRKLRGPDGGAGGEGPPMQELSGPGVRGYWFEATDPELVHRPPGRDEYRALLQGAASVGTLLVAFTLLDGGDGPQRDEALRLVATARAVHGP